MEAKWETVSGACSNYTRRLQVPSGWIYEVWRDGRDAYGVFVPAPAPAPRLLRALRDAVDEGEMEQRKIMARLTVVEGVVLGRAPDVTQRTEY